MKSIFFVAPPFAGHLNPLLVLAVAARDAGFNATVITGDRKLDAVRGLGLKALGLRSIGAETLEAIANSPSKVGNNPLRLLNQFRENLALLPALRRELLEIWAKDRPDLVVADSVAPVGGVVCDELRIPWITTIATPFAIESPRGVPAYCGGWRPGGWPGRDAFGRLAIRTFKQAVAWYFRKEFSLLGDRFPYRDDGSERIYSPRAILGFGLNELEFERDWPRCFQMIGPVIACPEDGPDLVSTPNRKRVLVSVGTHLVWAKRTLPGKVIQLSREFPEVEFVVSMGGNPGAGLRVSNTVTVHPFVSYTRNLAAFDAVIHHGGAGVTYAAILHGVPSVVVPHDYDQFDYAARVEHFQLGLRATSIATAGKALRRTLDRAEWPELRQMRDKAQQYSPEERFLAVVREIF